MRIAAIIVLLFSLPVFADAAPPGLKLRHEIAKLATALSDGPATLAQKSISVTYAKLPTLHSFTRSAVVLFTMESFGGGNNYRQFLAVFYHDPKNDPDSRPGHWPYHKWRLAAVTVVGQDFYRIFNSVVVQNTTIKLSGLSWVHGQDSQCCPTGKARAAYQFSPYTLRRLSGAT